MSFNLDLTHIDYIVFRTGHTSRILHALLLSGIAEPVTGGYKLNNVFADADDWTEGMIPYFDKLQEKEFEYGICGYNMNEEGLQVNFFDSIMYIYDTEGPLGVDTGTDTGVGTQNTYIFNHEGYERINGVIPEEGQRAFICVEAFVFDDLYDGIKVLGKLGYISGFGEFDDMAPITNISCTVKDGVKILIVDLDTKDE